MTVSGKIWRDWKSPLQRLAARPGGHARCGLMAFEDLFGADGDCGGRTGLRMSRNRVQEFAAKAEGWPVGAQGKQCARMSDPRASDRTAIEQGAKAAELFDAVDSLILSGWRSG